MKLIGMIPARMGSKRLPQKNLQLLDGRPLIVHAIQKCKDAGVFDEIYVNSEHPHFGEIAAAEGVSFHQRPEELGSDTATSEQFVLEFLDAHPCDYLFQVHSIAPLLGAATVRDFVKATLDSRADAMLSIVEERIECAYLGKPVNFSFETKTNSQELNPLQRVTWSITGWRSETYRKVARQGGCATYAGKVDMYPIDRLAGHIIKTDEDLRIAEALLPLVRQR